MQFEMCSLCNGPFQLCQVVPFNPPVRTRLTLSYSMVPEKSEESSPTAGTVGSDGQMIGLSSFNASKQSTTSACVRLWFAKDAKPIARCRDEAKEEGEGEEDEEEEEQELIFLIL